MDDFNTEGNLQEVYEALDDYDKAEVDELVDSGVSLEEALYQLSLL